MLHLQISRRLSLVNLQALVGIPTLGIRLSRLNLRTVAAPGIPTADLLTLARLLRLNRLTVGRQLTLQASRLTAAILGIVATLLQISQLTVETPTLEIVVRQHLVNLQTVAILGTLIVALVQLLQVNQPTVAILDLVRLLRHNL